MTGRNRGFKAMALCIGALLGAACGGETDGTLDGAEADGGIGTSEAGAAEASPISTMDAPYSFRLDSERSDPGDFRLQPDEGGALRIVTGPAGIAYRAADQIRSGDFQVEATFTQFGAPVGYREAFGLFVGGLDLDSPDQEYTYLLIRGTGDFLIKRRVGATTEAIVDWTPHSAVAAVTEGTSEPVNHLAITSLDGETVFVINGVAVHGMPTPEARPYGIAGIRANHRLDVRVDGWSLEAAGS